MRFASASGMMSEDVALALKHLHLAEYVAAHAAAVKALREQPRSSWIKGLVFRINAEEWLAQGKLDAAERECEAAMAQSPESLPLVRLALRIRQARGTRRMGLLARLRQARLRVPA
jgi:hypothetical protein